MLRDRVAFQKYDNIYKILFDNSMDGLLITKPDGTILTANNAFCSMVGYSHEEICSIGRAGIIDITDPNLPQLLAEREETGYARGELSVIRKDGTRIPVEISSRLCENGEGEVCTSMIIRDLTRQKTAEQTLKESEDRFSRSFQMAPIAMALTTLNEGLCLDVNKEFLELLGYSRQEVVGRTSEESIRFAPQERAKFVNKLRDNGFIRNFETKIYTKSGQERHVIASSEIIEIKGQQLLISTFYDITERKQMEERLKESEDLLRVLVSSLEEGVVLHGEDGRILSVNQSALEIMELTEDQMTGRTSFDPRWSAIHEDGSPFEGNDHPAIVSLRTGKTCHNVIMGIQRPQNGLVWISISSKPLLRPGSDKPYGAVASFFDITGQKQTQEYLVNQVMYDSLTKLPNRVLFLEELERAIAQAKREVRQFAVAFIDLDHFKEVNDTYGHQVGDHLLKQVGNRIKASLRAMDTVARLSGDEFVLLISNIKSRGAVLNLKQKIEKELKKPFQVEEHSIMISASIGLSFYPQDGDNPSELIGKADKAMYRVKLELKKLE